MGRVVDTEVDTEKMGTAGYCWEKKAWERYDRCVGAVRVVWPSWGRV